MTTSPATNMRKCVIGLAPFRTSREHFHQAFPGLALPVADHVRMHSLPGSQLGNRLLTSKRLQGHFRFEPG